MKVGVSQESLIVVRQISRIPRSYKYWMANSHALMNINTNLVTFLPELIRYIIMVTKSGLIKQHPHRVILSKQRV